MKKTIIILLLASAFCNAQSPTFKDELFGKTNILHIGKHGFIEKDKFLHSTAGAWVGSSVYMYSYYKTDNKILSLGLAVLSAFAIGEAKELYDRSNGKKFSNSDLAVTTLGGFTGTFTKIIQIDIQQKNKMLSAEYKAEFENLNSKPILP